MKFNLILLNETWSSGFDNFYLEGYTFLDFNRKSKHPCAIRSSGGIGLFIKNNIESGIHIHKVHKDAIVWIKLSKDFFHLKHDFYICCVYFPPENST